MYTSRSTLTRIAISKTEAIGARTTAAVFLLLDIFSDPNIWEMNTFHKNAIRRLMHARNAGNLTLITVGEGDFPSVTDYDVKCR